MRGSGDPGWFSTGAQRNPQHGVEAARAMSLQSSLFQEPATIRNPICSYERHCGHRAEILRVEDRGGCVNTETRCLTCGDRGVVSERKDLR